MNLQNRLLTCWRALQNSLQVLDEALWPSGLLSDKAIPANTSAPPVSALPPGLFEWRSHAHDVLQTVILNEIAKAQSRGETCVWVTPEMPPLLQNLQSNGIDSNALFVVRATEKHNGWELIVNVLTSRTVDWLVVDHLSSWVLHHPPTSPQEAFVWMHKLRSQAHQFSCRLVWLHVQEQEGAPKEYVWLRNELHCQATKLVAACPGSL